MNHENQWSAQQVLYIYFLSFFPVVDIYIYYIWLTFIFFKKLQIWGFEIIDNSRYYVRHLRFTKFATPAAAGAAETAAPATAPETGESPPVTTAGSPEKVIEMKLVYDYAGV